MKTHKKITACLLIFTMIASMMSSSVFTTQAENDIKVGADFSSVSMPQAGANGFIASINPIPSNIPEANIVRIDNANILTTNWAQSGKYYVLEEDINLTAEWVPINNFAGSVFDGQGHSINNLYIMGRQYAGFFGQITVSNFTIKNVGINIGVNGINVYYYYTPYAGGLIGYASGNVSVTNCYATGNVEASSYSSSYAGGLIGYASGNVSVTNCYTTGDVEASASGPSS